MPGRIWKRSGDTHYGYGNGFRAVVYDEGLIPVLVFVYKGDREVKTTHLPDVDTAKRWAERNYLKGTK